MKRLLVMVAACCLFSSSAWADGGPPTVACTDPVTGDPIDIQETRDGTGLVGLHSCWAANPANDKVRNLNDLYVRWTVERIEASTIKDRARDYDSEKRPAILRLFFGQDNSFVSSLRIDMHDPNLTFVLPLVTFGHEGRVGKGESWATDVISDDQTAKYFRVGANTSATIAVTAKANKEMDVRAASNVIGALRSIASLVSPGGSLLTTLNRETSTRTAEEVDQAISNIWSESISEQQISGRSLDEWYENASFLVQVNVPEFVRLAKDPGQNKREQLERWYRVRLSCPRYSMFYSRTACANRPTAMIHALYGDGQGDQDRIGFRLWDFQDAVRPIFDRVSAEQILNFPLAPNKTIQSYLSDQPWYTKFLRMEDKASIAESGKVKLQTPAGGGAAGAGAAAGARVAEPTPQDGPPPEDSSSDKVEKTRSAEDYAILCHSVVDVLYGAGLSAFDSRLALWALVTNSQDFVGLRSKFQGAYDCRNLLPGTEYGPWQYVRPSYNEPKGAVGSTKSNKKRPKRG